MNIIVKEICLEKEETKEETKKEQPKTNQKTNKNADPKNRKN